MDGKIPNKIITTEEYGESVAMLIYGKQITDECQYCGDVLQCELFKDGHGIHRERKRIPQMVDCQIGHRHKRCEDMRKQKQCGACQYIDIESCGLVCDNDDALNFRKSVELITHGCKDFKVRGSR